MSPVLASSGFHALQILHEAEREGRPFRLVLADVQMPGIDGFELVRRLTTQTSSSPPPIMMLSSVGLQMSSARCKELGISAYMTKPVTTAALSEAVAWALQVPAEAMYRTEPEDSPKPGGLRILVAEDDPNNRLLVVNILKKTGHSVMIAKDGGEAIEAFSRTAIDLILMDIQMPNISGMEAAATIRKLEQATNRHVPILALTAHAMEGDRERCLQAGMDDYLAKPIRSHDLLEKIASLAAADSRG
jgi:CheY-like chemotaxis protein